MLDLVTFCNSRYKKEKDNDGKLEPRDWVLGGPKTTMSLLSLAFFDYESIKSIH